MKLKKIPELLADSNRSRQERIYLLIGLIGLAGLATGIIAGALAGENINNIIAMIGSFIFLLGLIVVTLRYRKIQLGAVIISAFVIYFVLPFNFLTSGGIYGGSPVWFVLGVVFVCLVVKNKTKYFFIASSIFTTALCYYIAYFFPEMVASHTLEVTYIDSFATLNIVTLIICGMIIFQNSIYQHEYEKAKKQKKEIEELNQMQNRFFSSMSHEIRTPINTIIGLNEMILREEVSDEVAEDARSIQGASKMLLALINDILDMSKIESGNMEIVPIAYDVGDMMSDIVNMIWIRAKEKGLEFHVNVDQAMPSKLFGDEVRIKQVLINVLNNAVKYTAEGSVTLSIQCKKQESGRALISYSVTDTGMGIKKENIPFLFNAFRRVDEEKNRYIEGTGLGLSIVKQLVDLMNGEIAVNSVYMKGSTFVITIPQDIVDESFIGELDLESRHALNERRYYKQSFEAPKAHILIVDDNDTNLMVAQKLLRDTKVNIETASNGLQCLKKTTEKRYDVIFMDHLMPEMDGIECLHEIRKQKGGLNKATPVVVLTANAGSENQMIYRREGFDGYLLKPVSGIQLETELLRHLSEGMVKLINTGSMAGSVETPVMEHSRIMTTMISTDSVCDIPEYLLDKYNIAVMPFRVLTEGGEFLDGVETETDGVLSYIGVSGKKAKSESPEVSDYEEYFAEKLTKAQFIIHISIAKNVSHGYEKALEASKAFDNVFVIDSGHLSSGIGLMVLRAAEYVANGAGPNAVIEKLEQIKSQIKTTFIVSSTEYMVMSDRISERINALCKAFMIRPIITMKHSYMKVGGLIVGTRSRAWKKYVSKALKKAHKIDKRIMFITYAGLTNEELQEIQNMVKDKVNVERIICQKASPSISANCGPGTFGLLYMMKSTDKGTEGDFDFAGGNEI